MSGPGETADATPSQSGGGQAVTWVVGVTMLAFAGLSIFLTLAVAFRAPGPLPVTVWFFAAVNVAVAAAGLGLLVSRQEGIRIAALALCAVKAASALYSTFSIVSALSRRGTPRELYLPSLGWGLTPVSILIFSIAVLVLARSLNGPRQPA